MTTSLLVVFVVLRLWRADLSIPLQYPTGSDAFFYLTLVKGTIENGWYLHNPRLGMPSGLYLYDFPRADSMHFAMMKLLGWFSQDCGRLLNIFFILTFPLTTLSALFVFRRFHVSWAASVPGALLYTFVPYHFMRGEEHLDLAAYFVIPLVVMVCLWVGADGDLSRRRLVSAVAIVVLLSCGMVYYTVFGGMLLLVSGAIASTTRRSVVPMVTACVLVLILGTGLAVNLAPSIRYARVHGKNSDTAQRAPFEAELYGLKIAQLLLPVQGHRVRALAELRARYDVPGLFNTENSFATLGAVASVGFLGLVAMLFSTDALRRCSILSLLARLNVAAVLVGTIGGFGALFALLVHPGIRCYNRVSIFIAFFSSFAVVVLLDRLYAGRLRGRRTLRWGVASMIAVFGLLDIISPAFVPDHAALAAAWANDRDFVRGIERTLPAGSMVFQLPYVPFPEAGSVHRLADYDLFRGYFHSNRLRWSYGAMRGREADRWQRQISARPVDEFLAGVTAAGFSGLYVDRRGYTDDAKMLEGELTSRLGPPQVESVDHHLVFFDLRRWGSSATSR